MTAAPLIGSGHSMIWLALTVAGCLTAVALSLSLRKLITAEQDGRTTADLTELPAATTTATPAEAPAHV